MAVAITPTIGLKKPDDTEFYDIEVQNSNSDLIDAELKRVSTQLGEMTLDCGTFDGDTPVNTHNASAAAHPNLIAYGGTLEEHMSDPLSHENIILDGNAG